MAINLDAIKNRLKTLGDGSQKRGLLWKPEPGETVIRIVPYQFNKDNPFIELYFHYDIGKRTYLSLETFGEADPVLEFANELKQTGGKEDFKLGRRMEPTLRTFVPIIVRGKEKEGVKFWGFGKTIYAELMKIITDPDYGDITDVLNGRDITVEYLTPAEAGNTWGKTSILVKPNQTPATKDREIATLIMEKQTDIFDIYKKSDYNQLKEALQKYLDGADSEESPEGESTDTEKKEEQKSETPIQSKKVTDATSAFDELFK